MTTSTNISFDDAALSGLSARDASSLPATTRRAVRTPAQPMPESLWRYTLQEHWTERRYRIITRNIFVTIAALAAGSIAYAIGQTCALMTGDHLQDAIAVLMR